MTFFPKEKRSPSPRAAEKVIFLNICTKKFAQILDSTVLAYIMKILNERYGYGLELFLLSIDEGIKGYRDDSLETVHNNSKQYCLPLMVLSYEDLYGWSMDKIVSLVGLKNNCTFCGVFRRQALERGAAKLNVDSIVTGHNADDIAETILMNILRGDVSRLGRCTHIASAEYQVANQSNPDREHIGNPTKKNVEVQEIKMKAIRRCKPFKYTYEKEIVMYAYYKKLEYFSTECTYSPNAYRGFARQFIKDLESIRPTAILDIIRSGESLHVGKRQREKLPEQVKCERCGFMASNRICKACLLLEGLNKGLPRLGIGRANQVKKPFEVEPQKFNPTNAKQTEDIEKKIDVLEI